MPELSTLDELRELRSRILSDEDGGRPTIIVCGCTACQASGSNRLIRSAKRHILLHDLVDRVKLRVSGCPGFSQMAPFLLTEPQGAFYPRLHHYHVPRIIDALLAGQYVDELLYAEPSSDKRYRHYTQIPFFNKQRRTLLLQNQLVDPIRLVDYLAKGGYLALEKVLARPEPQWIIEQIKCSGLRGRGGAGFPTGRKWELALQQRSDGRKYVVCNADEGDPGAYMDRGILEGNPHCVIEGMIIGGIAMQATEGIVFVRHEYPLAIKHTIIALRLAREYGLLGKNILGTGIDFDINIVKGAGAFVCGEETALIRTVEGQIGEPKQRPPYPIQKGISGAPTCINNVETWANVPVIIQQGASAFAQVGTAKSTGTKVFSLVGKIRNTGLVEVPMGMSIGEMVYDIGGGPVGGSRIKAVQIGGPSGGCIPHSRFDLPIDYDSLTTAGAIMGSGGMIVMDQSTCMVDIAKYFMNFLQEESCGKCFTCRKGTQRLHEILGEVCDGEATLDKLDLLEELAMAVKDTTMCGLGQSAANPVLSTLRYFRDEYVRHIVDKRCDAFVCKSLVGAACQSACPIGTEAWRYVAHIARGEYEQAYLAIRQANPFPSVCARVCDHPCELKCRLGATGQEPVAIRALKRFVTDTIDPSVYQPTRAADRDLGQVAVVGAGPAGLTAAHLLSLQGYQVTVYDANDRPGGMLVLGVPAYRLPRHVVEREISALLDDSITLKMGTVLGRDFTIEQLFAEGYQAVFLAIGSLKSQALGIDGESAGGVYPSIHYLREFNLRGNSLAKGNVVVLGGGNSAVDAARMALRQEGVDRVTIVYRRTREEMPAFREEVEAAIEEGVILAPLLSPVLIHARNGTVTGIECISNELGARDESGRRQPVAVPGTEHTIPADTVVVAIGEKPDVGLACGGQAASLQTTKWGGIEVDAETLATDHAGLFAGGDVVTGSNTVVEAIAAGKRAATMIGRYLRGEPLRQPVAAVRPCVYIEPVDTDATAQNDGDGQRCSVPHVAAAKRVSSFIEVEKTVNQDTATREARRCLRCDLEYTRPTAAPADGKRANGGQG